MVELFSQQNRYLKHIGKVKSTGERLAILYMNIPDSIPPQALVLYIDSLGDVDHDEVCKIIQLQSSQEENNLADAFHKHKILQTLHEKYSGTAMVALDIDLVDLTPYHNYSYDLREVLNNINKARGQPAIPEKEIFSNPANTTPPPTETVPTEVLEEDMDSEGKARSLIRQAEMLEQGARDYRQKAQSLAPHLFEIGDSVEMVEEHDESEHVEEDVRDNQDELEIY